MVGPENQVKRAYMPVLMVDDEPDNVEDLEFLINSMENYVRSDLGREVGDENLVFPCGRLAQYTFGPEEALGLMKEFRNVNYHFSAVICDNHMKGEIRGEDFCRIISGNPFYCFSGDENDLDMKLDGFENFGDMMRAVATYREDDEHLRFLEDNFESPDEYNGFVDYHFNWERPLALIMLCGYTGEDSLDRSGLDDVPIFKKKRNGKKEVHCEAEVMRYLASAGVFSSSYVEMAIAEHHRIGDAVPLNGQVYRGRGVVKDPKRDKPGFKGDGLAGGLGPSYFWGKGI